MARREWFKRLLRAAHLAPADRRKPGFASRYPPFLEDLEAVSGAHSAPSKGFGCLARFNLLHHAETSPLTFAKMMSPFALGLVLLLAGTGPRVEAAPIVSAITLELAGLHGEPGRSFAADGVRGGATYAVGARTRFDPFEVILRTDPQGLSFLEQAFLNGNVFPNAQLRVLTAGTQLFVSFDLTDVNLSSFHLLQEGRDSFQVQIDLSFHHLKKDGPGAAQSLPAFGPAQPLTGVTLSLQGLPAEVHLDAVDAGESFQVGRSPSFDFQANMRVDSTTPLLFQAEINGTIFPTAQLSLFTGNQHRERTFDLTDLFLTSFAVDQTGHVHFGFIAASLRRI
jgi:type VI protein secretion system component Hcp